MREKVAVLPVKACEGLDRLAITRRDEIEELKEELSTLEGEVLNLDSKSAP